MPQLFHLMDSQAGLIAEVCEAHVLLFPSQTAVRTTLTGPCDVCRFRHAPMLEAIRDLYPGSTALGALHRASAEGLLTDNERRALVALFD